jgi:hypothetical protein
LQTAAGKDPVDLLAECEAAAPRLIATWSGFAGRFAQVVRQHADRMARHPKTFDGIAVRPSTACDPESVTEAAAPRLIRA